MLYGAYKTGYKFGGYSGGKLLYGNATTTAADVSFKPEKSHGGEIGAKGLFLDDKLQITGAIYDYTYENLQESIFNTATTSFSTKNAAAASTKGIESDITWRVIPELTLNAGLTYSRARFTDYGNASCYSAEPGPTCNPTTAGTLPYQYLTGTRLPYSSDWAESVGFKRERPIPMLDGYLFALGSHMQYLSTFVTDTNENPTARFGPELLLDANLTVYPVSERWKVAVTGRNLLNEQYLASAVDRAGSSNAVGGPVSDVNGTLNRPREIWLPLTEKFCCGPTNSPIAAPPSWFQPRGSISRTHPPSLAHEWLQCRFKVSSRQPCRHHPEYLKNLFDTCRGRKASGCSFSAI